MKKLLPIVFVLLSLCSAVSVMAQNKSQLRGRVLDTEGQPLIGAIIQVVGGETNAVTTTDIDGEYILARLSAGEQTFEFSYTGYESKTVEFDVAANQTNTLDITLEYEAVDIDKIEIQASARQNYQRAINYQKNSGNLRNVVSADQVGRFPDANIGDALKRISGINVQYDQGEARFGQIRGTSPEFSAVTINGNRAPSAESNARSAQLDLIPADMVQTVVVNKVVTADMDGDAIGGSVDLVTKSHPTKQIINGVLGTGYNVVSKKLQFNGAVTYGDKIGDNFGFIAAISYQNNPIGSDNTEFEWAQNASGAGMHVTDYQIRKYLVHRERQSYSLYAGYKIDASHKIDFKGILNIRNDWENRFRYRLKDVDESGLASSVIYQTKGGAADVNDARLEKQMLMDYSLNGEHLFGNVLLDWNVSYSRATEDRPDERYIAYKSKDILFNANYSDMQQPIFTPVTASQNDITNGSYSLDELTQSNQNVVENDLKARLNLTIPILLGYQPGSIKMGVKYVNKDKLKDVVFYDYSPLSSDFDAQTLSAANLFRPIDGNYLAGNYSVGNFITETYLGGLDLTNTGKFSAEENLEEAAGDFSANESVLSGYIRFDQKITDNLSVIAGIRAEQTMLSNQGYQLKEENKVITLTPTGRQTSDYLSLLPSLLLRYDFSQNSVLRASYTRTLARPNYYDLVPYESINVSDNELSLGNSQLSPTYSDNIDLSFEHYFPNFGQISVGGYYKNVTNFIAEQLWRDRSYEGTIYDKVTQPINGGDATIIGAEFSLQKDFGFISPALRHFGLYLNYTYTHSRINNFQLDRENPDGTPLTGEHLSLPGSPAHIGNASIYYEEGGLDIRVSYNMASSFIEEFGSTPLEDVYYDKVNYVDVNASYTFGKNYTLFVDATNLLNQPLRYYQGSSQYTFQSEYYGPRFNIGLRIAL